MERRANWEEQDYMCALLGGGVDGFERTGGKRGTGQISQHGLIK